MKKVILHIFKITLILLGFSGAFAQSSLAPSDNVIPASVLSEWEQVGEFEITPYENAQYLNFLEFNNFYIVQEADVYYIEATNLNTLFNQLDLTSTTYLLFPEGTYFLSRNESINVPSNLIIHGEGSNKTNFVLTAFQTKTDVFSFNNTEHAGIEYLSIDASHLFDMELAQDKTDYEENFTNTALINFSNSTQCRAVGVKTYMGMGAHYTIHASNYLTIHGCHMTEAWLHGSHVGGTQGYGVVFSGSASNFSSHCLIENNIIERCRHAIVVQYYAQDNVIGYNYTTNSRAYNYVGTWQLDWPSSDIVLHGNGPGRNLVEGNFTEGVENGLYSSQGITIDNVKDQDNQPYNAIFRNSTPMLIRVQDQGCGYNDEQYIIGNKAGGYNINAENHTLVYNVITSLELPIELGLNCMGDANINITNTPQNDIGISSYLSDIPEWLSENPLPVFGPDAASESIPAYDRYDDEMSTTPCTYCSITTNTKTVDQLKEGIDFNIYPNPTSDILYVSIPEVDNANPVNLTLYSMDGKEVLFQKINTSNSAIYLMELESGNYYASISNQRGLQMKEVLIKK